MGNIDVCLNLEKEDFIQKYHREKLVAFYTLGCKVNQYETDAMQHLFLEAGYKVVQFEEFADVYVINTCTVTAMSDNKSRKMIRRAKKNNSNSIVAVVGCYSQKSPDEVLLIEGVNLVMGTSDRNKIVNEVEKLNTLQKINEVSDIMKMRIFEPLNIDETYGKARAFLKIQEGCDRFCTYCIIPYTRGPVRSRQLENIINEVETLAKNNYKEIVLTGIHVASYGKELENVSLIDVIVSISRIKGIERIRTSSVEPIIITDVFLNELKKVEQFCPHFHLSLQSGCDSVLKRMNRRYTTNEYEKAVAKIRKIFPEAAITTDIIVGFPGETNEEFEETRKFLEKVNLYEMHIFKYSRREGTKAALMDEQVDPIIKNLRSDILLNLSKQNKTLFVEKLIGKQTLVLFETNNGDEYEGHTDNYVKVFAESKENITGKLVMVKIIKIINDKVYSEIV